MTKQEEDLLDRMLDEGLLLLKPTFVRRLYMDGGRLGLARKPGGTFSPRLGLWRPERWIASTVSSSHPLPVKDEGQSRIARSGFTFRQALERCGERIMGREFITAYGPLFPVLIKILDPGEPIVFHFHATDADVKRYPESFPGQHSGKDEAYYFLPAPKGVVPYTHVGLYPGVTQQVLADAIDRGTALDLSPVFSQRAGEGFYVPAGIPHRPGTALTLEIQQPSDVFTLLERWWGTRKLSATQMHPGFASLEDALSLIDYTTSSKAGLLEGNRLVPEPITGGGTRGGQEFWIFPPRLRKFSGKRLVVHTRYESQESAPYVVFVWRGHGRLKGQRLAAGTEVVVTAEVATRLHLYEAERGPLELFKLFPPSPP